jgi:hypothetical protein
MSKATDFSKSGSGSTDIDVELGKILKTEEIELSSAYGDASNNASQSGMQAPASRDSNSSSKPLQQGSIRRDCDTTWLDLDVDEPPSPDRARRKSIDDML